MVDPNRRDSQPAQQVFPSRLQLVRDKDRPGGIGQPEEIVVCGLDELPIIDQNAAGAH